MSVAQYAPWIANFDCGEAKNGIVEIKIDNLDSLYNILKKDTSSANLEDPAEDILIVHCNFPNAFQHHSNSVYIEQTNIQHNKIFIKFPTYSIPYCLNISIQGHSHTIVNHYTTKAKISTYPLSKSTTLHIPSFLSHECYNVGDNVQIQDPLTNRMVNGKIDNVMNDNFYTVSCKKQTVRKNIISIFPVSTGLKYTLKWENVREDVNMNLYFYKYYLCEETRLIIESIFDYFENDRYFGDAYDTWLINYGHEDKYYLQIISNFLVENICSFMFEVKYKYNIKCMVDRPDMCGILEFCNVWQYYLKSKKEYELGECILVNCHCCGSPLNQWDFGYFCCENHIVCIECINTIIDSWNQLQPLLCTILKDQLHNDCIQIITDYVVGTVCICNENETNEYANECMDIDVIHNDVITDNNHNIFNEPPLKKRRLNN